MPEPQYRTQEQRQEYFIGTLRKTQIIGLKMAEIEAPHGKLGKGEVERLKKEYSDFVLKTVAGLKAGGFGEPKSGAELLKLLGEASRAVWGKFAVNSAEGSRPFLLDLKNGALDCDTSTYVFADVLRFFGIDCHMARFSTREFWEKKTSTTHIMLQIPAKKGAYGEIFVETTWRLFDGAGMLGRGIRSRQDAKREYGWMDFEGRVEDICGLMSLTSVGGLKLVDAEMKRARQGGIDGKLKAELLDALEYVKKAAKECEKRLPNTTFHAQLLYTMGLTHKFMGNYAESLAYYGKALKASGNSMQKSIICTELGFLHGIRGKLGLAAEYYGMAVSEWNENAIAHLGLAKTLNLMGKGKEAEGEFAKALQCGASGQEVEDARRKSGKSKP